MAPKAPYTYIGFGGPKGGGKSFGARAISFTLTWMIPIVVILVRSRLKTLKRNHIIPAKNELREFIESGEIEYKDQDNMFLMPSGGIVQFMHCQGDADVAQFDGVGADLYILEEAGHFTKWQMDGILKNNRPSDIAINRGAEWNPRSLFTFNWGGPGHDTLKRWFWDRIFEEGEDPGEFSNLIFASVLDNKEMLRRDKKYLKRLRALPKQLRRAYLLGDPEAFTGSMFTIIRQYHEIRPAAAFPDTGGKVPEDWELYGSLDAGTRVCAFGLYAKSPEGKLIKVKQYYNNEGANAPTHIGNIVDMIENCWYTDGRMPSIIFSDSWAFGAHERHAIQSHDATWADIFNSYGYYVHQVKYGREAAIMGLQTALHFEMDVEYNEVISYPKLQLIEGECEPFINEALKAERDENNPEVLSKNSADHAIDETKNLVMSAPSPPDIEPPRTRRRPNPDRDFGSDISIVELLRKQKEEDQHNWENLY